MVAVGGLHALVIPLAAAACLAGCGPREASPPEGLRQTVIDPSPTIPEPPSPGPALTFRSQELPFRYDRGETGAKWPVEVTGGGVGLLDFDGDGDLDIFFAQGGPLAGDPGSSRPADVLLRNDGDGIFTDVSAEIGLAPRGYGQGVTVADFDGDGHPDVYVTRYGQNTLWRNVGGRFVDGTDEAGVGGGDLWSLGAAFFDGDGDGDLDLFVANYFDFDPSRAPYARTPEGRPEYGAPGDFPGQPDRLFRNEGDGKFADVSDAAGIAGAGRGMGAIATDLDGDGRTDVLVANDAEANAAWLARGDGTFEEAATVLGLDLNGRGQSEANMGIALADFDGDGLRDVIITHFVGEHDTLWAARATAGGRIYQDVTFATGLGSGSLPYTGWGVALADFDLDGFPDLIVANGHIRAEPGQFAEVATPPILWRNVAGRFVEATAGAGPYFRGRYEARGLAAGDLDGDGDLDLVIVHHDAPAVVLWNESPRQGSWLILDLEGAGPNPDAIGATATIEAGGRKFVGGIDGGGGYLSTGDRRIHFGLGPAQRVDRAEVRWPSGRVEVREDLPVNKVIRWAEGEEGR